MRQSGYYGIGLAAIGALVLTPDALFMRLSGMDGLEMQGWRGICVGFVFWSLWALRRPQGDRLSALATPAGAVLVLAQFLNASLFPLGIAVAPVAVVLLSLATVPVWAALLSRIVLHEPTSRATWLAIAAVLCGIALAVSGKGGGIAEDRLSVNGALIGAMCGLGAAVSLATTFVTLRRDPSLPLLPALGSGAAISGILGVVLTGPEQMMTGNIPAILVTGLFILPASFFALSYASRHTQAANVSLLMLLETVLGPLWVWLFLGETATARMLAGGAIVILSLVLYILAPAITRGRSKAGASAG